MGQTGPDRSEELKDDGVLIYERDLVTPEPKPGQRAFGVSSTRIAEEQGYPLRAGVEPE